MIEMRAPLGFNKILRCPICSQFPRTEVFQCNAGHSVCANCFTKLRKCPTCQGLLQKVRKYLEEGLLDSMEFQCSWKDLGCASTSEAWKDLTSHEAQCDFNPNSVKFCSSFFEESCKNKFCPISTQDPAEMNVFLNHLKSEHGFAIQDVNHRESFSIHLKHNWSANVLWPKNPVMLLRREGQLFKTVFRLHSTQANQGRCQLFVILSQFTQVNGEAVFVIKCVRLTEENQEEMSISFSLKAEQKKKNYPRKGRLPDLSWTEEPQGLLELKGSSKDRHPFLETLVENLSSYHVISSGLLQSYITGNGLTIDCIFSSM